MASVQDLYNAVVAATQSINKFTITFPRTGGGFTPINNLSSSAFVQVLAPNANRNAISFHNPGANPVYVAPTTLGSSGGAFSPTPTALGGTVEVVPGGWVTLSGTVQQGWQALASAGSNQPLTIMDQ